MKWTLACNAWPTGLELIIFVTSTVFFCNGDVIGYCQILITVIEIPIVVNELQFATIILTDKMTAHYNMIQ